MKFIFAVLLFVCVLCPVSLFAQETEADEYADYYKNAENRKLQSKRLPELNPAQRYEKELLSKKHQKTRATKRASGRRGSSSSASSSASASKSSSAKKTSGSKSGIPSLSSGMFIK